MTIWTSYLYPAIGLTRLIKRHKNRLPFRFIPIVFENPAYRFPEELHIYSIASIIVTSRPLRGRTLSKLYLGSHNPQFATALTGNVVTGTPNPLTLLHLGGEGASGAGWRDWMDIGTYYASREGFDNMYVGLRRIAADRNEAIINFGNNPSGNPSNDDLLRFVFTAAPGNGLASSGDGFELARMWVDGQDNGRMGIGDFFTAATQPENTLEIMASESSPYWNQPDGTS